MFRRNRSVGLMIADNVNEFQLASILDTYGRSFPSSLKTISLQAIEHNDSTVQTKYGLTLVCTGDRSYQKLDELHVLATGSVAKVEEKLFSNTEIVNYDGLSPEYPIDTYLERISKLYGPGFKNVVKLMLDYN